MEKSDKPLAEEGGAEPMLTNGILNEIAACIGKEGVRGKAGGREPSPRVWQWVSDEERYGVFEPAAPTVREGVVQIIKRGDCTLTERHQELLGSMDFKTRFKGTSIDPHEFWNSDTTPKRRGEIMQEVQTRNAALLRGAMHVLGFVWMRVTAEGDVVEGSKEVWERRIEGECKEQAIKDNVMHFVFMLDKVR